MFDLPHALNYPSPGCDAITRTITGGLKPRTV